MREESTQQPLLRGHDPNALAGYRLRKRGIPGGHVAGCSGHSGLFCGDVASLNLINRTFTLINYCTVIN